MTRILVTAALLVASQSAYGEQILYESATLGPTEITAGEINSGTVPGSNLNQFIFIGARFELTESVVTSRVGGHFTAAGGNGTLFGALVALDGPEDFPDSELLSTPDVLGDTLLVFPEPSAQVLGNLELSLQPGWYAVVFGSGLFGASGTGVTVRNNSDINGVDTISRQIGPWGVLPPTIASGYHFIVLGQQIPEPSSGILIVLALLSLPKRRKTWRG